MEFISNFFKKISWKCSNKGSPPIESRDALGCRDDKSDYPKSATHYETGFR